MYENIRVPSLRNKRPIGKIENGWWSLLFGGRSLSAQARHYKDQPVCYGTSLLNNWFCFKARYALLKTLTLYPQCSAANGYK